MDPQDAHRGSQNEESEVRTSLLETQFWARIGVSGQDCGNSRRSYLKRPKETGTSTSTMLRAKRQIARRSSYPRRGSRSSIIHPTLLTLPPQTSSTSPSRRRCSRAWRSSTRASRRSGPGREGHPGSQFCDAFRK
ncbi:Uncharacterized protein FKW44_004396 [Caligus rogercresseyi]|uniref:Uncharacterized protein n=1 Tax=Caligus rogercresseyi TaxID=217165 RepID=A0A7T8KB12_CALRO|nr:Uncharacterized protein FKW44_004396 [Caligus rogercresseyi]